MERKQQHLQTVARFSISIFYALYSVYLSSKIFYFDAIIFVSHMKLIKYKNDCGKLSWMIIAFATNNNNKNIQIYGSISIKLYDLISLFSILLKHTLYGINFVAAHISGLYAKEMKCGWFFIIKRCYWRWCGEL